MADRHVTGAARRPRRSSDDTSPAARPGTGTYLYCLVRAPRAPATAGAPRGLPGTAALRAVAVGEGLWLIAAGAPRPRYGAEAIRRGLKDFDWVARCALAHERVVEHFSASATALPMRLFTIFDSEARARAHIARSRARLERDLDRVEGRREWGVRLSVDVPAAKARAAARARDLPAPGPAGTRFLLMKREQRAAAARLAADSRERARELLAGLRRHADDARTRPPLAADGQSRLVLDAAFLVRERKTSAFRAAFRRESARLEKEGYSVALTGPWPPYNFVGAKA